MAKRSREAKQRAQRKRSQELAQSVTKTSVKTVSKAATSASKAEQLTAHLSLEHLRRDLFKTGVVTTIIVAFLVGLYLAL